jgi:hypothetical protein
MMGPAREGSATEGEPLAGIDVRHYYRKIRYIHPILEYEPEVYWASTTEPSTAKGIFFSSQEI